MWVSTQRDHWRFPPEDADEYVDVAVLPYRPDAGRLTTERCIDPCSLHSG